MRKRSMGLVAAGLILAPVAASAQYHGGGHEERRRDIHVERYRPRNHDDVVVHRERRDYDGRGFHGERRHHDRRRHDED